jgi:hypothetical protein
MAIAIIPDWIRIELSEDQLKPLTRTSANALILAATGSGKAKTLVHLVGADLHARELQRGPMRFVKVFVRARGQLKSMTLEGSVAKLNGESRQAVKMHRRHPANCQASPMGWAAAAGWAVASESSVASVWE